MFSKNIAFNEVLYRQGVNFTNILHAAFARADPKIPKAGLYFLRF